MDVDKIKQWLQFAQQVQGSGDFWNSIFDSNNTNSFMNEQSTSKPSSFHMETASPVPEAFPLIDILLEDEFIHLIVALPGVMKDDMKLLVSNDTVFLKGIVKPLFENVQTVTSERKYGPFERTIKLPEPVVSGNIKAKYYNGLLVATFPRIVTNAEQINIE